MEKLLTVAIAACNMEKYLPRSMDSVLGALHEKSESGRDNDFGTGYAQIKEDVPDHPDTAALIELLVIDDGSTDDTFGIASCYEKKFPGVVRVIRKENGGYGSVVNLAIKTAKGKYFKLLDADDEFYAKGFKQLVRRLGVCDADVVLTPYYKRYVKNSSSFGEMRNVKKSFSFCEVKEAKKEACFCDDLKPATEPAMHSLTVKTSRLRECGHALPGNCLYTDTEFAAMALLYARSMETLSVPVYIHHLDRKGQSVNVKNMIRNYRDHRCVFLRICRMWEGRAFAKGRRMVEGLLSDMIYTQLKLYYLKPFSRGSFAKSRMFIDCVRHGFPVLYAVMIRRKKILWLFVSDAAPVFYPALHFALSLRYHEEIY